LELLVAMAVLSLLVVLLLGLVDSATKLWRANENRVESYREARAALNLMASDLRAFYASTNAALFLTNLPGTISSTPDNAQIGFLAALPISAQNPDSRSDLCTVGYFLAFGRNSPFNTTQGFNLYRYFRESNATWDRLQANPAAPEIIGEANPGNSETGTNVEILARNILEFETRFLDANRNAWTRTPSDPLPDSVELRIVALNNETAQRLRTESEWNTFRAETNAPSYTQNTRKFTTRVPLRQPVMSPTPTPTP
jgi:type II secretory pathway pseudopilin PulG